MRNNYYFENNGNSAEGMTEFDKKSIAYLNEEYNYSVEQVVKDSGLKPEDFNKYQDMWLNKVEEYYKLM